MLLSGTQLRQPTTEPQIIIRGFKGGMQVDNSLGAGGAIMYHPDSSYLLLLQQVIQRISLLLLASLLAWSSTSSTRCCASLQMKIHNTTRTSREHMQFPVPPIPPCLW